MNKSFDGQPVIKNFNMCVEPEGMKIILGGSGSGKSTILKMVLGLIRPDSGKVHVEGKNVAQLEEEELMPIRSQIGMVFQEGALFDSLTVADNVSFRLREHTEADEEEIRLTVMRILSFVGLERAVDRMPAELSGGMKRRVAIARALVGNPPIMLYDEPTAGLDPITGRTICELVIRLRDLERVTSIFVTHDLNSARTMANEIAEKDGEGNVVFRRQENGGSENTRFLILSDGSVLLEGTNEDLKTTDNTYIREFLD